MFVGIKNDAEVCNMWCYKKKAVLILLQERLLRKNIKCCHGKSIDQAYHILKIQVMCQPIFSLNIPQFQQIKDRILSFLLILVMYFFWVCAHACMHVEEMLQLLGNTYFSRYISYL